MKDLRCIINPINDKKGDNECFQYSTALLKHKEIGNNSNRVFKIKPYLRNLNFKYIKYPLKREDYETFERNNESISLNILKPDNAKKKVYYHFKSKNTGRKIKIYLLLLENKHYIYFSRPNMVG